MERRTLLRALTAGSAVAATALATRHLRALGAPHTVTSTAPAGAPDARRPDAPPAPATQPRTEAPDAPSVPEDEATSTEAAPTEEVADDAEALATLPAIAVLCREATGLAAPLDGGREHRISTLTLHHTGVRHERAAEGPRRMRGHQRHHLAQGWIDVAYHYGVDLSGNVYELRDVGLAGDTFTEYDPAGHFLVVCEGDYDTQRPTDAMLAAVAGLFADAAVRFGVPPSTIAGHRDHASTRCPGSSLAEALPSLREEVARLAELGAPTLQRMCGSEGAARIALIEAA